MLGNKVLGSITADVKEIAEEVSFAYIAIFIHLMNLVMVAGEASSNKSENSSQE
jgi:hypothetical protein